MKYTINSAIQKVNQKYANETFSLGAYDCYQYMLEYLDIVYPDNDMARPQYNTIAQVVNMYRDIGLADELSRCFDLIVNPGDCIDGDIVETLLPSIPGLGASAANPRELNLLCKNAEIPGKQILTVNRNIAMTNEKISYGYAINDLSMTFYVMNDYGTRRYFDSWMDFIVDQRTNEVAYHNNYVREVEIHQLRKPIITKSFDLGPVDIGINIGGGTVYSVKLVDAFPTSMSSIALSNDQDGLVELTIQFSYKRWETIDGPQNFIGASIGL